MNEDAWKVKHTIREGIEGYARANDITVVQAAYKAVVLVNGRRVDPEEVWLMVKPLKGDDVD